MKENFSDNYVIGFGGEYYTLWEKCHNSDGEVEHLIYVKNISKERSVAEKLFPGVEINETLHGYKYEVREVDPIYKMPNVFKFGRYKGEPIYIEGMEISKVYAGYVANMIGWFLTDDDQISAAKVLNESGFYKAEVIKNSDGHVSHISVMSVEEYEEMIENKVKRENLIDGDSFSITLNRNLGNGVSILTMTFQLNLISRILPSIVIRVITMVCPQKMEKVRELRARPLRLPILRL